MAKRGLPALDVVIVAYQSRETIEALIRSLTRLTAWGRLSVHIHENSNDQELLRTVVRLCEECGLTVIAVACSENCGFAKACNSGAWSTAGEWILFINPDAEVVEFPRGWVPTPGIWGPEVIDHKGRRVFLYGIRRGLSSELRRMVIRRDQRPRGHGYVSGACLLVDRTSWTALGGFDEGYYMYYEDIDLGLRASAMGIPVRVNSDWVVRHKGGHSSASGKDRVMRISARSSVLFHRQHGHWWRGWAAFMMVYFGARAVAARNWDEGASSAYLVAAREYQNLLRGEPANG